MSWRKRSKFPAKPEKLKYHKQKNKDDKNRILLATNMDELLILKGIVETAKLHMPRTIAYTNDYHRLKNIFRCLKNFVKEYETEKYNECKS